MIESHPSEKDQVQTLRVHHIHYLVENVLNAALRTT